MHALDEIIFYSSAEIMINYINPKAILFSNILYNNTIFDLEIESA